MKTDNLLKAKEKVMGVKGEIVVGETQLKREISLNNKSDVLLCWKQREERNEITNTVESHYERTLLWNISEQLAALRPGLRLVDLDMVDGCC